MNKHKSDLELNGILGIKVGLLALLGVLLAEAVLVFGIRYVQEREGSARLASMQEALAASQPVDEAAELETDSPLTAGIETFPGSFPETKQEEVSDDQMADEVQPAQNPYAVAADRQMQPRFAELFAQNPEFMGWLTIEGTEVNYPVMFREGDNDFYLTHNFEGAEDRNGLLVLDKRCDPLGDGVNSLIHGHNMKSGAMFGGLKYYTDPDYCRAHPSITFSTLYEERTFEIVAVFRSSVYDENTTDFQFFNYINIEDEETFDSYVASAKENALYDTGISAAWGDRLITLSTCEYSKENGRLVIVGRSYP